jgi:hypothetical protein
MQDLVACRLLVQVLTASSVGCSPFRLILVLMLFELVVVEVLIVIRLRRVDGCAPSPLNQFTSVVEWISSTLSGRDERHGATLPLVFSIH